MMNSEQSQQSTSPCYTDYALQEYVQGRHTAELRQAIADHLTQCDACRGMEAELNLEKQYLSQIRNCAKENASDKCPDELDLAKFMDNALINEVHDSIENHLLTCDSCRSQLISLYREVREALSSAQELKTLEDKGVKPDLILLKSKREVLPKAQKLPRFPMRGTGTDVR